MGQLEEWLKLAPVPGPLKAGRKWHVFLSYRSTERKWALALYDVLTQLKYQVFMDQFVLVAGEALASSIGENLEASESGVLVWSTRSEDSAWCKKEYNSFEAREALGDFPFVAVRLQNAPLPIFVQGALWIDASDQLDGAARIAGYQGGHMDILSRVAILFSDTDEVDKLLAARSAEELFELLNAVNED